MTRDVALAETKKCNKSTRKNVKAPCGVEPFPLAEWLELAEKKPNRLWWGTVRQLSPLFHAPQYAEQFIELARKTIQCRDLRIRAKRIMTDTEGRPIINPKTKAQRVGFCEWQPDNRTQAA